MTATSSTSETSGTVLAPFALDAWEESADPAVPGGPVTAAVVMRKTYPGERLTGTSTGHVLTVLGPHGGAYLAMERITATLDGRRGTFVLVHRSTGPESTEAEVVTGSGTGELAGLAGTGSVRHGELTLTFTLG